MRIKTGSKPNHLARWFNPHWTGLMIKRRRYHTKKTPDKRYAYTSVCSTGHTTQHQTKVLFLVKQILLNAIQQYVHMYQFTFTDTFLIEWAHFRALLFEFFFCNFSDYFASPSLNFLWRNAACHCSHRYNTIAHRRTQSDPFLHLPDDYMVVTKIGHNSFFFFALCAKSVV